MKSAHVMCPALTLFWTIAKYHAEKNNISIVEELERKNISKHSYASNKLEEWSTLKNNIHQLIVMKLKFDKKKRMKDNEMLIEKITGGKWRLKQLFDLNLVHKEERDQEAEKEM
jgi:hypothetical protein